MKNIFFEKFVSPTSPPGPLLTLKHPGVLREELLQGQRYLIHTSPYIWLRSQIIPIAKKGDLTLPTNHRGISLLPIAAKIYNKLLLNRIRAEVDPILRKNQNGFRPGRSTLGQILTLRRIIEEITFCNKTAALTLSTSAKLLTQSTAILCLRFLNCMVYQ